MHDKVAEARADFARKLAAEQMRPFLFDKRESKLGAPSRYQVTRRLGLPPQYMTFLALAACDPDRDNVKAAKSLACNLVKSWRAAAERTKQTLPNASMGLPEAQLPWLIHLCAHHPDFAEEEAAMEDDDDGEHKGSTLPTTQRMLDFYINACLANGANEFDLLRHVVSKVKTAVDRLSVNGQETRIVTAIARQLIEYRGDKATWSTKTIPPNLALPALLYCRPSEQQQHGNVDLLPQNFTFIDGLKTSGHGFGAAATSAASGNAVQQSTAVVAHGHGGKRPSAGKFVPSPVKRSKKSAKADESDDDESEDEEDRWEREEREREEREKKQQEERAARRAQREQRSEVLALPAPKEAAATKRSPPKRARQEEVLALPAPKEPASKAARATRGVAKTSAAAPVDAENDGPNPKAGRAARSTRSARA
jgi:type II secretory pathway pseudopilin PulG